MNGRLDGKIALITGGSSGIGLAIAKRFVEEGAFVYLFGRRLDQLEKARDEIRENVEIVRGDVAELDDLDRLFARITAGKGALDIVVASAAFSEFAKLSAVTPEHFDRTFGTNARGTFFTVQKAMPLLRTGGSVIMVGSAGHLQGVSVYTTYSATKAALRSFARTWVVDLQALGVRVNTLSPGPVETPMVDRMFPDPAVAAKARANIAKSVPLGRPGDPDEIASAAVFLASSDSSFMTGHDLVVDGGQTAL